jgi:hypothetical protein
LTELVQFNRCESELIKASLSTSSITMEITGHFIEAWGHAFPCKSKVLTSVP